jgi:polysaccharide deacetylase family protein (PEP-CTERM system associated)
MLRNILTVDLEDWFVVENLKGAIEYDQWNELPSRVIENTEKILSLFEMHNVRATFFVLGWIAEKFPGLINNIYQHGHEIACHSYAHSRVDLLKQKEFKKDTQRAVKAISDACGILPIGYRAPSWSINSKIKWAFEILADMGFLYDSSLYPIKHDIYGEPHGLRVIGRIPLDNGNYIYEIPASTVKFLGKNFPVGGGGYLRLSPVWFTERMIRKLNRAGQPAVIYLHPWEIDENQPRVEKLSPLQKYRQYGSISLLLKKLDILLKRFDFCTAGDYITQLKKRPIGFDR